MAANQLLQFDSYSLNSTQINTGAINYLYSVQKQAVKTWAELDIAFEIIFASDQEKLEKTKAEYVEKMKNKIALIHKAAEEKRAMIEAKRGEDLLKAEEIAAKYRATGTAPKKLLGCF